MKINMYNTCIPQTAEREFVVSWEVEQFLSTSSTQTSNPLINNKYDKQITQKKGEKKNNERNQAHKIVQKLIITSITKHTLEEKKSFEHEVEILKRKNTEKGGKSLYTEKG